MKIFLIGFMGCGKSTTGKKLAGRLGYAFVDLDQEVERQTGSTIANYFALHGEEAFRQLESETLKAFPYPENCVVATGGGAPCYFDNLDWMNSKGLTIYIQMSPAALAQRLEKGKAKRPLLKDLNEEQLIRFIEGKLGERESFYSRASMVVNGVSLTAEDLAAQLP